MIFCLFFLENNVLEAHKIAQREKTQNNISFVAILENMSVPRLVANINVIINAYDLDNIFFNIKNINMIPKVVINDIGSCLGKSHDSKNSDAYGVYLLPPLSAAYSSSSSLRAPPSLV